MAALVVVTVSPANEVSEKEDRIEILPAGPDNGIGLDEESTRFELDVDGAPVSMLTAVQCESGLPVRKTETAEFPAGLPAGWHDFSGGWYDGGRLILPSRTSIQFV